MGDHDSYSDMGSGPSAPNYLAAYSTPEDSGVKGKNRHQAIGSRKIAGKRRKGEVEVRRMKT